MNPLDRKLANYIPHGRYKGIDVPVALVTVETENGTRELAKNARGDAIALRQNGRLVYALPGGGRVVL